jgi:nitroimidazol reductase NimA-like FMN-containing flavoprotein (pyridoxamine 5'-phosphate oxidase superfamily)
MSREFALAVVDTCAFGMMATVNSDGTPYCIPLSIARDGEWIYFHSAREGHKIDNLKYRNKVCVSCVGKIREAPGEFSIGFESAVINGAAEEVSNREEKIHALRIISERYTPENMAAFDGVIAKVLDVTGIWKIHIDEISGKGK